MDNRREPEQRADNRVDDKRTIAEGVQWQRASLGTGVQWSRTFFAVARPDNGRARHQNMA
mgnify:CR=1 FL=1